MLNRKEGTAWKVGFHPDLIDITVQPWEGRVPPRPVLWIVPNPMKIFLTLENISRNRKN